MASSVVAKHMVTLLFTPPFHIERGMASSVAVRKANNDDSYPAQSTRSCFSSIPIESSLTDVMMLVMLVVLMPAAEVILLKLGLTMVSTTAAMTPAATAKRRKPMHLWRFGWLQVEHHVCCKLAWIDAQVHSGKGGMQETKIKACICLYSLVREQASRDVLDDLGGLFHRELRVGCSVSGVQGGMTHIGAGRTHTSISFRSSTILFSFSVWSFKPCAACLNQVPTWYSVPGSPDP